MTDDRDDLEKDDALRAQLRTWQAPAAPAGLDGRVAASYRAHLGRSRWRRLWTARVNVPLPVAALLVIALLAAIGLAARGSRPVPTAGADHDAPTSANSGLANLRPLPEVRMRVARQGERE